MGNCDTARPTYADRPIAQRQLEWITEGRRGGSSSEARESLVPRDPRSDNSACLYVIRLLDCPSQNGHRENGVGMKKLFVGAAVLTVGGWAIASGAVVVPTAFASPNNGTTFNTTTHCDPSAPPDPNNPACGQNPVFVGPPKAGVVAPNCPPFLSIDNWTLSFTGGNSVAHFTANNNGDWGTGTSEGPAVLATSGGTVEYAGHLTEWFGFGENTQSPPNSPPPNQARQGFTLTFNGTGPAGSISIHVDNHQTQNNNGIPTANTSNANASCS